MKNTTAHLVTISNAALATVTGGDITGLPEWRKYVKVYPMPKSNLRNGVPIR